MRDVPFGDLHVRRRIPHEPVREVRRFDDEQRISCRPNDRADSPCSCRTLARQMRLRRSGHHAGVVNHLLQDRDRFQATARSGRSCCSSACTLGTPYHDAPLRQRPIFGPSAWPRGPLSDHDDDRRRPSARPRAPPSSPGSAIWRVGDERRAIVASRDRPSRTGCNCRSWDQ